MPGVASGPLFSPVLMALRGFAGKVAGRLAGHMADLLSSFAKGITNPTC